LLNNLVILVTPSHQQGLPDLLQGAEHVEEYLLAVWPARLAVLSGDMTTSKIAQAARKQRREAELLLSAIPRCGTGCTLLPAFWSISIFIIIILILILILLFGRGGYLSSSKVVGAVIIFCLCYCV